MLRAIEASFKMSECVSCHITLIQQQTESDEEDEEEEGPLLRPSR